ncbi:hypothetical protein AVEN_125677-1 [Araneus ventricosus]|uniref:Uncharacterized protein n=1 Tax=Araneus ventricosus TaxID=182803 RepID=A0A4Y2L0A5_ARAVE|nr:hypothetical protein AVEN_125677-1 [Araneus ventricosus]
MSLGGLGKCICGFRSVNNAHQRADGAIVSRSPERCRDIWKAQRPRIAVRIPTSTVHNLEFTPKVCQATRRWIKSTQSCVRTACLPQILPEVRVIAAVGTRMSNVRTCKCICMRCSG